MNANVPVSFNVVCAEFLIGLDELRVAIDGDHSSTSMKSLCQYTEEEVTYLIPESAAPLHGFDIKFDIMLSCKSVLFERIWEKQMETSAASTERLVIEDIRTVLWENSFKECNCLLDSLIDRSIKLGDVNYYFRPIEDCMKSEIQKLCVGVQSCVNSGQEKSTTWIDSVVHHIQDYWSLLTLAEEARAVMALKSKLLLTDNFEAVLTLSNQVISCSFGSLVVKVVSLSP